MEEKKDLVIKGPKEKKSVGFKIEKKPAVSRKQEQAGRQERNKREEVARERGITWLLRQKILGKRRAS